MGLPRKAEILLYSQVGGDSGKLGTGRVEGATEREWGREDGEGAARGGWGKMRSREGARPGPL